MPLLVIDLAKAGKKGSVWGKHKYLVKFVLPDGAVRYVYPDDKDLAETNEKGQMVLKRPVAQIINEQVFGGPTGRENKATGEPEVKDGIFYTYDAVHPGTEESYKRKKRLAWLRAHGVDVEKPDGSETHGAWRVYRYRKVPGFVGIDVHKQLTGALGYKLPQKIENLQITEPESVARAQELMLGPGEAPETPVRPVPSPSAPPKEAAATPPIGVTSIHVPPVQSPATQEALDLGVTEEVDPLVAAGKLKALITSAVGKKIKPWPAWVLNKFGNEQTLLDKLQKQPATTLVTLGVYKPTRWSTKLNERLQVEWTPIILGLSRDDFDAYKATKLYATWQARDEAEGLDPTLPTSHTYKFRLQVMKDLLNDGLEKLVHLARNYKATQEDDDNRFDKYAYTSLDNHIAARSRREAESHELLIPLVHDEDVDIAARKQGSQYPFSPEEMHGLAVLTGPAKDALLSVFSEKNMPEAYRRVFLARLWLDDVTLGGGSLEEERLRLEKRKEQRSSTGELPKQGWEWEREWTGQGGIASKYNEWVDPKTGKTIKMSEVSQTTQWRYLSEWYSSAQTMVASALGKKGKLTEKGKLVHRWLELEAKLADTNRRTHAEREQHPIIPMPFTTGVTSPVAKVAVVPQKPIPAPGAPIPIQSLPKRIPATGIHPAVAFFTTTSNQELARKLGLKLETPSGSGGVYQQPGVSLGSLAQRHLSAAERFHSTLTQFKTLHPKKVVRRVLVATAKHKVLTALAPKIGQLHAAAQEVHEARAVIHEKKARASGVRHEYGATSFTPSEVKAKVAELTVAPTEEEKARAQKAQERFDHIADAVAEHQPVTVAQYKQALFKREPIADYHLAGARSRLKVAQQNVQHEIDLLQYEQGRRSALKKVTKSVVFVSDFVRVLNDYDFALGRLHAELS